MTEQTSNSALSDKQLVANYAASFVENNMVVGLGTGSTANYFIEQLARRKQQEGLDVTAVASSIVSTIKAQQLGLPLVAIEHISQLDLYVDGADEITADMSLLKGRGFDLVKEKLLAKASDKFYVMAEQAKCVSRIGEKYPIPVEVAPFSWQMVLRSLEQIGGEGGLRPNSNGDGLVITTHGSLVLDMTFDKSLDANELNAQLNNIPGIVEHGVFYQLATDIFIANHGVIEHRDS
jgi:ribose 5-phosphate isomerase A